MVTSPARTGERPKRRRRTLRTTPGAASFAASEGAGASSFSLSSIWSRSSCPASTTLPSMPMTTPGCAARTASSVSSAFCRRSRASSQSPARSRAGLGLTAFAGAVARPVAALLAGQGSAVVELGIDQGERDLGHSGGLAVARAGEDDVLHADAAQALGGLLAQHPHDGVGDVRLAAAVGADHGGDAVSRQMDLRAVAERLEAEHLDLFELEQTTPPGTTARLSQRREADVQTHAARRADWMSRTASNLAARGGGINNTNSTSCG